MINKHSQQGLTTLGWIAVIGIFGLLVVSGFKILPMYLDFFKVKSVMESLIDDESVNVRSKADMWLAMSKRLQINDVSSLKRENVTFSREEDVTTVTADYEVRKPYLAELFIGAHFTYSVEIKR